MKQTVLVSGSLAYDRIAYFPGVFSEHILPEKIHTLSVSFNIKSIAEHFGGTAGNIAYTLALLGKKPKILGSVGNDFGRYKKHLKRSGVETRGVREVPKDRTASAWIMTDKKDNQITAFHLGAMVRSWKHEVGSQKEWTKNVAFAIVSPGNVKDMGRLPAEFRKYGIPYAFDPGQTLPVLSRKALRDGVTGAAVLFVNDYELALLSKRSGLNHQQLRDSVHTLVTTLGPKGSRIESEGKTYRIPPAKPKAVVDPTGAGDCYRAGFIYGLLAGWPLEMVGRFAGLVAVYTVEKLGTQTHEFTWNELRGRYKTNFGRRLLQAAAEAKLLEAEGARSLASWPVRRGTNH